MEVRRPVGVALVLLGVLVLTLGSAISMNRYYLGHEKVIERAALTPPPAASLLAVGVVFLISAARGRRTLRSMVGAVLALALLALADEAPEHIGATVTKGSDAGVIATGIVMLRSASCSFHPGSGRAARPRRAER